MKELNEEEQRFIAEEVVSDWHLQCLFTYNGSSETHIQTFLASNLIYDILASVFIV